VIMTTTTTQQVPFTTLLIFLYLLDLTAFVTFLKTSFRSLILDDKAFKWKSENCLVFYKTNIIKLHLIFLKSYYFYTYSLLIRHGRFVSTLNLNLNNK